MQRLSRLVQVLRVFDSQQDLRPSPQKREGENESQRELGRKAGKCRVLDLRWPLHSRHTALMAHWLHKTCRPASRRGWGRGYGQLMEKGVIVLSDKAASEVSMQAGLVKLSGSQNKIQVKDDDGKGLVGRKKGGYGGGAKRDWVCGTRMYCIRV